MRIFLIINLLIVIINSIEYRINNNCAWPDDCYITMKFTKTCAIESATVEKAVVNKLTEEEVREMEKNRNINCFGFPKESKVRCYNRCDKGPKVMPNNIPENHIYEYTSKTFKEKLKEYKTLSKSTESIRVKKFGWVTVEEKDKPEEYKYWKDCVMKELNNSTSIQTNSESKALVQLDLKCGQASDFCLFTIEYTLDRIKSIKSHVQKTRLNEEWYSKNVHSCRIYDNEIECLCKLSNSRCRSFDHLIESIYLLGRDKVIRGIYRGIGNNNRTEYNENIPKVLEMLQNIRTNYPKDIYGSTNLDCFRNEESCKGYCTQKFEIDDNCEKVELLYSPYETTFILPHRFVDTDRTGSIAVEVIFVYQTLYVKVYCKMGCIDNAALYASIMDVLNRQMETKDDIILFTSNSIDNKGKEEYFACAYYSFRNTILKSMYGTYNIPTEQPQTKRAIPKSNEILSLVISTIFASIIIVMIILIIIVGTISYFKSQTKKQPITFSKKTVIARKPKQIGKSAEFVNSKDKTGDFYDNISRKTSTVNNTDLASVLEEAKSKD